MNSNVCAKLLAVLFAVLSGVLFVALVLTGGRLNVTQSIQRTMLYTTPGTQYKADTSLGMHAPHEWTLETWINTLFGQILIYGIVRYRTPKTLNLHRSRKREVSYMIPIKDCH